MIHSLLQVWGASAANRAPGVLQWGQFWSGRPWQEEPTLCLEVCCLMTCSYPASSPLCTRHLFPSLNPRYVILGGAILHFRRGCRISPRPENNCFSGYNSCSCSLSLSLCGAVHQKWTGNHTSVTGHLRSQKRRECTKNVWTCVRQLENVLSQLKAERLAGTTLPSSLVSSSLTEPPRGFDADKRPYLHDVKENILISCQVFSPTKQHALYLWIHLRPEANAKQCVKTVANLQSHVNAVCPADMRDEDNEILAGVGFGPEFWYKVSQSVSLWACVCVGGGARVSNANEFSGLKVPVCLIQTVCWIKPWNLVANLFWYLVLGQSGNLRNSDEIIS